MKPTPPSGVSIPNDNLRIDIKYSEPEKNSKPKTNEYAALDKSLWNILLSKPVKIKAIEWIIWYSFAVLKVSILSAIWSSKACAPNAPINTYNKLNNIPIRNIWTAVITLI